MKEYDYGDEFETLYKDIPKTTGEVKTGRKELSYKVFLRAKKQFYNVDLEEALQAKDKLEGVNGCTNCGATELICGYRGFDEGCTSER